MRLYLSESIITSWCLCLAIQADTYAGDFKPYSLPPTARARIEDLAASSDILILGEIHGTQEVPELVAGLLESLTKIGYRTLALEVPNNYQAPLREWLSGKTEKIPDFFTHPNGDGRGNAQLLALARIAASPPFQWQIICFDESEVAQEERWSRLQKKAPNNRGRFQLADEDAIGDWRERDAAMASNLLEEAKSSKATGKILAICGNVHARTTNNVQEPMLSKLWPSFAAVLKQRQPVRRVRSVNIEFCGGAYFNDGRVRALPKRPLEHPVVRSAGQTGWDLELSLPIASPASFLGPEQVPAGQGAADGPAKANRPGP